ncbi:acetaldehyde dehydrogenase [Gammaproteobacteria bacterium]|nr:acetaldehyde dehydrogenase [Gammaproteobacteria bacterium]
MIADNDLISIQQARILAENAFNAQKKLSSFTQEQLDKIVECVASELENKLEFLAKLSCDETDFGRWQDKYFKNNFVCTTIREQLQGLHCVGVIKEDQHKRTVDIGVPVGVIIALCPVTSPVSTTIYKTLIALKSGNAIIFSPHPRAIKSISSVLDIMIRTAQEHGLPEGCLSYLKSVTKSGTLELINHPVTSLVMITGVPSMYKAASCSGKPIIYGGTGNGPAFIERSANITQAVQDILQSKTFDYGIAPSAEHCVVIDACIDKEVKSSFKDNGAYFMTEAESIMLAERLFYADGKGRKDMVGKPASVLAQRAGFTVPEHTRLLIAERSHVLDTDIYVKELLSPVLAYYVEDDWMHACEKCIELLLHERNGHTLTIHSHNEEIIRLFALKKPVGRLLVNTPAAFGGIGATTNLFPALTLGSGSAGFGLTADNVSPLNLIYIRKVGYGVKNIEHKASQANQENQMPQANNAEKTQAFKQLILKVIKELS